MKTKSTKEGLVLLLDDAEAETLYAHLLHRRGTMARELEGMLNDFDAHNAGLKEDSF